MTFSKSIATRHKESFFKVEESDKKWKEGSVDFNITRYFIYFSVDYFFFKLRYSYSKGGQNKHYCSFLSNFDAGVYP